MYLEHAERLLSEGDLTQAGEKYWGAAATRVKAIAETRNWRHFSHADIGRSLRRLAGERTDESIATLYKAAESLHANFYEDFMDMAEVTDKGNNVKRLIEILSPLYITETLP